MKKENKKVIFTFTIILVILTIMFFLLRSKENASYKNLGEELISKIEAFRTDYNRLPNSIDELGLVEPMSEGPYYEKKDSLNYIVYFNIGFDNAITYFSETKKWKDLP